MSKCITCKHGQLQSGKSTYTSDSNGILVVIRSVPALVCDACGADYFDEAVTTSFCSRWMTPARLAQK